MSFLLVLTDVIVLVPVMAFVLKTQPDEHEQDHDYEHGRPQIIKNRRKMRRKGLLSA